MKLKTIDIFILFIVGLGGCSIPNGPTEQLQSLYTPMNVGDVWQYINIADSSTLLVEVVDTLKRIDGLKVFQINSITGNWMPRITFDAIKDGYYIRTLLDSTQNTINPFNEERIAKGYPSNGETWQDVLGDPQSSYTTAILYRSKRTILRTFPNVFAFFSHNKSNLNNIYGITVYYAENIGYIGTEFNNNGQLGLSLTYAKVGNNIYGTLWPTKNPTPPFGEY